MPIDVMATLRDYQHLQSLRAPWEPDWQSIAEIMHPALSDITTHRQPGTRRTQHVFDTTAMWALDTFTSHLIAGIMNFSVSWFNLRMRAIADDQEGQQWLDEVATLMHEEMSANTSLVPASSYETLKAYAGFGTGVFYLDEQPVTARSGAGWRGYQALSLPIGSYVIADGANGIVDTLMRECELSPRQAAQTFGEADLAPEMRQVLRDTVNTQAQYQPHTFLHVVKPRADVDRTRSRSDADNMPWASYYIDLKHKHMVSESGYRWFPFLVPRWEKLSVYSPWGWGRGHMVLPESLTLNTIDKDALRALPMGVFPPGWLSGGDDDAIGRVSLLPGTVNPIARGAQWIPYNTGGNINLQQLQVEQRQSRILRAFWIDQLQFLPDPASRTQRTLGELQLRSRFMARLMGPTTTIRLLAEYLNPFVDVAFALLLHAGVLPEPPESIILAAMQNQGQIDVEYEGPLARAVKEEESDTILEALRVAGEAEQLIPGAQLAENLDLDEAYRRYLEVRGFPKALLKDMRVVRELRLAASRQQQQEQLARQAGAAAPAMKAIGELAGAAV